MGMPTALITGAAGFVGVNMCMHLSRLGWRVIAVDSLARPGVDRNIVWLRSEHPDIRFEKRELEDVPSLIYSVRPDAVCHFAAQVAVTASVESPLRDFHINAAGSLLVARAAYDVRAALLYTSTNKVYGDNVNRLPLIELPTRWDFGPPYSGRGVAETLSIDTGHHTPYGVSKLVGELYVREFGGIANRCSCMYGPHQFGIVDQGWISHIARNKVLDQETTIYGDGKQVRDALHIDDVVTLFTKQLEMLLGPSAKAVRGKAFNVGGGAENTISLIELCRRWDIVPTYGPERPADQKVFYCDVSSARSVFDWRPTVAVDHGLDDLMEWTKRELAKTA